MTRKIISILCVLIPGFMSLATAGQTDEVKITPIPVTEQVYMLEGHGGNIIYIAQKKKTALVITADPYSNSKALSSHFGELIADILKALK